MGQISHKFRAFEYRIDENDALKSDLDIDFTMPSDVAELEAKINSRLGTDA